MDKIRKAEVIKMSMKWFSTSYPGVRYREHPTRRHGVQRDRYFVVYFRVAGKRFEEALGWSSEGWTAARASELLAELKRAQRTGIGPATLKEKRIIAERERVRQSLTGITIQELWENDYSPQAKSRLKPESYCREDSLFRHWISPRIGKYVVGEVRDIDIEAIMDDMSSAKKAARTIEYMLGVVNRLWKLALRRGIVEVSSPTSRIQKPKVNNSRLRCFTPDELKDLLNDLELRDKHAADLTLFAALTGCRFSEAASLKWEHVDFVHESATFITTKNDEPREVFLSSELLEMLGKRGQGRVGECVFTSASGKPWKDIPHAFRSAIEKLGVNVDRSPRERLTFHSLRHTAATFAARRGLPVKDLQEMFGWKTPAMVFRYAKGSEDVQRKAVRGIAQALLGQEGKVLPFPGGKVAGDD